MAKRSTPARQGTAKEEVRPQAGEVGADGELVRDSVKAAEPEIKVVHAPAEGAVEAEPKPPQADPDLNEKLAGLEREMKAERQAREAAERERDEARRVAQERGTAAQTNEDAAFRNHKSAIASAAAAAKGDLANAKIAYTQAMEAGDFTRGADAQEAIAEAKARQMNLDAEQQRIDAWEKRPKQEPRQEQTQQPRTPRETVDVRAMPRAARDYLEDHPEFLDDQKLWNRLTRAHQDAIDDDVDPYSDEYFEKYIHPRMGTGEPEQRRQAPASRGRSGDGALPPSRGGPSSPGTRNASEVSLTPRQVDAAHFSFKSDIASGRMTEQEAEIEYARNMLALQADGKIGHRN